MILLFTVSGVSAKLALDKQSSREFLAARTEKLLVPSTVGLLVFQWIGGYVSMTVAGAFDELSAAVPKFVLYLILVFSGTGVLWFIQLLWIYSVLLLLVRRIEKDRIRNRFKNCGIVCLLFMTVPLWLSAQILNMPVISVYRFGIYGMAFLLGYFVFSHEAVVERLSELFLPLGLTAILLGGLYAQYYFGENYAEKPVVNSFFSVAYGWIAVLAVFAVMKRFGDKTSPFANWMGRHSFGIYVFHYLPLSAAAYWICRNYRLPAVPSYLITAAAAFAGSILLYELISRIPVIRWCVLGIHKKREKDV